MFAKVQRRGGEIAIVSHLVTLYPAQMIVVALRHSGFVTAALADAAVRCP